MKYTYTPSENLTWQRLLAKRQASLPEQACEMYLQGLENLQLPLAHIPTPLEMNKKIQRFSLWKLIPSTILIPSAPYFRMLARCQFPVITSIRPSDAIAYYQSPKPDLIHEYVGHAPYLTIAPFTQFMQRMAQIATTYALAEQRLLARLFWFTLEFGLIDTPQGLRAYGAGILPSEDESEHALYSKHAERREFNLLDVLRTPISATEKQKVYFVIARFEDLFSLHQKDLSHALAQVKYDPTISP